MNKLVAVLILFGTCCVGYWLYDNRKEVNQFETVPNRFLGSWHLIGDNLSDNEGVRKIVFYSYKIELETYNRDDGSASKTYPVIKIFDERRRKSHAGEMTIFYGNPNSNHIAEHRMHIYYGSKEKIKVYDIVSTGHDDDDHFFEIGDFVRLSVAAD